MVWAMTSMGDLVCLLSAMTSQLPPAGWARLALSDEDKCDCEHAHGAGWRGTAFELISAKRNGVFCRECLPLIPEDICDAVESTGLRIMVELDPKGDN